MYMRDVTVLMNLLINFQIPAAQFFLTSLEMIPSHTSMERNYINQIIANTRVQAHTQTDGWRRGLRVG